MAISLVKTDAATGVTCPVDTCDISNFLAVDQNGRLVVTAQGLLAIGLPEDAPATVPASTDPETVVALLKAILNKDNEININADAINLNTDELESALGLVSGVYAALEDDPTAETGLIGYVRGLLKQVNEAVATAVKKVDAAADKVETYTWLDFGIATQRVSTIAYASASLSLGYTETFAYTLVSGKYRLDTITIS